MYFASWFWRIMKRYYWSTIVPQFTYTNIINLRLFTTALTLRPQRTMKARHSRWTVTYWIVGFLSPKVEQHFHPNIAERDPGIGVLFVHLVENLLEFLLSRTPSKKLFFHFPSSKRRRPANSLTKHTKAKDYTKTWNKQHPPSKVGFNSFFSSSKAHLFCLICLQRTYAI